VYPHLHDHHRWVLPEVLDEQARRHGDRTFVTVIGEGDLTYAGARADATRMASHLRAAGVGRGDPVAVVLPNGLDFVRLWLGLGHVGAVMVPVNTALTGDFLTHQLRDSAARLVVAAGEAAASVEDALGDMPGLRRLSLDGWREHVAVPAPGAGSANRSTPGDLACVMYTSGTTGPSKGVLMPHAHCYLFGLGAIESLGLTSDDRYYICMPFFHANGLFMQLYATLIAGGSAVVRPRFSASAWLSDIREHGCTVTNLLGSMSQFVGARPAADDDRDHALRVICPVPNPPAHEQVWRERFGIPDVVSAYGMTEVNIPLYGRLGQSRPGTAGRALERFFEVSIRHPDTDDTVPPGEVGEIMVRPRVPYGFMAGYARLPEATVDAWRNFWFHTGDSGTADAEGWVTFVDRTKDCIRRRGENISSFEVETAVARLAGVAEVAAYAVPAGAEGTEDEVMLAVVAEPGCDLSPAEVAAHADRVLPRFAQPRWVELVDEIPRTPTEKVRKAELRRRGVTPSTWDRLGDGARS
jgi:crotonobetaine/carnitine-CoA ligase